MGTVLDGESTDWETLHREEEKHDVNTAERGEGK